MENDCSDCPGGRRSNADADAVSVRITGSSQSGSLRMGLSRHTPSYFGSHASWK
jgi:hypothetical protein